MKKKSALVAMSGGVDSSTAAAILVEEGFRVLGVTMLLTSDDGTDSGGTSLSEGHVRDAVHVCRRLGIDHETMDLRDEFRSVVVDPFIETYLAGQTPNPCILCNEHVKFRFLLEKTRMLGADMVATGHYARIVCNDPLGLSRGADPDKDQSYFLFFLGQAELGRLLFPLGGMTKGEVRKKARGLGLPVHEKDESQDACFIHPEGVRDFLLQNALSLPGPGWFVDSEGNRLGSHQGACFFTVGQRKGLGVASRLPLYVVRIDVAANEVVLGSREEALSRGLVLSRPRWVKGFPPEFPFQSMVQVRHRQVPVRCQTESLPGGSLRVTFDEGQHGVAPGQAAVFYDGENLLGGGWISENVPMGSKS